MTLQNMVQAGPSSSSGARGPPPRFWLPPPSASGATAGWRSVSRTMRAPAGLPSSRSSACVWSANSTTRLGRHHGIPVRRRHSRVMPEKDAPLDTRRELALLVVEDEDKAADDEDAATLAS